MEVTLFPYIQETLLDNKAAPPAFAMGITETWLNDSISDAQTQLKNYQCIRSGRDSRRGGGCALYMRCKLVSTSQVLANDAHHNLVAVYIESLHAMLNYVKMFVYLSKMFLDAV